MMITIRLYKRHDLDLMYLYKLTNTNFSFTETLKNAVKGYAEGKPVANTIPSGSFSSIANFPTTVQLHISLDPETDQNIIRWLNTITIGRRNCMIKHLLRNTFPVIDVPFLVGSEGESIPQKTHNKAAPKATENKSDLPTTSNNGDIFSQFGNLMKGV